MTIRSFLHLDAIQFRPLGALLDRTPRDGTEGTEKKLLSDEQVKEIIQREGRGNSYKAIRVLASDAAKARERARRFEDDFKAAKEKGIAPPDGVILTGDEAKAYADVQKFLTDSKITVKELLANAKDAPDLREKVVKAERTTSVGEAADENEWDAKVLGEVIEDKGLELAKQNARREVNGKRVVTEEWHVRKAGDSKAQWEPLADYAQSNFKLYLHALENGVDEETETEDDGEGNTSTEARERRRQGAPREDGTKFVAQRGSKEPPPQNGKDVKKLREEAIESGIYTTL